MASAPFELPLRALLVISAHCGPRTPTRGFRDAALEPRLDCDGSSATCNLPNSTALQAAKDAYLLSGLICLGFRRLLVVFAVQKISIFSHLCRIRTTYQKGYERTNLSHTF